MTAGRKRRLYIISDLHLGGAFPLREGDRGFRMMTHPDVLASFIDEIREAHAPDAEPAVELVINGDFIDFLAEPEGDGWVSFRSKPEDALATFLHVAGRPEDGAVFDALERFLGAKHTLTVIVGNHDLELFLEPVREAFERKVKAPKGSVRWIVDAPAYRVGDVHIEHGNAFDGHNRVDATSYAEHRRLVAARMNPRSAEFVTPVGSRIVAYAMNPIKKDYAFIDLLKPEKAGLFALLLALTPRLWPIILKVLAVATTPGAKLALALYDRVSPAAGAPTMPPSVPTSQSEADLIRAIFLGEGAPDPAVVAAVDALLAQGTSTAAPAAGPAQERAVTSGREKVLDALDFAPVLGLVAAAQFAPTELRDRLVLVRAAIRRLQDDRTFLQGHEALDWIDEGVAARAKEPVGNGPKVVVFGHTHHARWIRAHGVTYVNTGTWANLMRFPEDLFDADTAQAERALLAFVQHLAANKLGRYVVFRPTYARVDLDGAGIAGRVLLGRYEKGRLDDEALVTDDPGRDVVDIPATRALDDA